MHKAQRSAGDQCRSRCRGLKPGKMSAYYNALKSAEIVNAKKADTTLIIINNGGGGQLIPYARARASSHDAGLPHRDDNAGARRKASRRYLLDQRDIGILTPIARQIDSWRHSPPRHKRGFAAKKISISAAMAPCNSKTHDDFIFLASV